MPVGPPQLGISSARALSSERVLLARTPGDGTPRPRVWPTPEATTLPSNSSPAHRHHRHTCMAWSSGCLCLVPWTALARPRPHSRQAYAVRCRIPRHHDITQMLSTVHTMRASPRCSCELAIEMRIARALRCARTLRTAAAAYRAAAGFRFGRVLRRSGNHRQDDDGREPKGEAWGCWRPVCGSLRSACVAVQPCWQPYGVRR